jgi:hypothetical protein
VFLPDILSTVVGLKKQQNKKILNGFRVSKTSFLKTLPVFTSFFNKFNKRASRNFYRVSIKFLSTAPGITGVRYLRTGLFFSPFGGAEIKKNSSLFKYYFQRKRWKTLSIFNK